MLISSPIVGIREPKCRPIETTIEKFIQLFNKNLIRSKEFNKPLRVMRSIKSIMPGSPFNIVIWEYVCPFFTANVEKCTIAVFGFKKFIFFIPNILIEFRSFYKIDLGFSFIEHLSYSTYTIVIIAVLQSFTTSGSRLLVKRNVT